MRNPGPCPNQELTDSRTYSYQVTPYCQLLLRQVTLAAHFMDLELLFSVSPFDPTVMAAASKLGDGGGNGGLGPAGEGVGVSARGAAARSPSTSKFSLLRPSWSTTLDLQVSQGGTVRQTASCSILKRKEVDSVLGG